MNRSFAGVLAPIVAFALAFTPASGAYTNTTTAPLAGGCPQLNRFALGLATPLNRRWSTSIPSTLSPVILTVAASGTSAQLDEIEQTVSASFAAWSGVDGTTFNFSAYPGMLAPLSRVSNANACTNDGQSNVDGLNTVCFNESSSAFTTGVLAFTRTITANAPGAVVGSSPPASFTGQILDSDTLFRDDGQATFATPAALSTASGQGAYDLESLLTHELGHWMGLGHSAVIRAMMFPYAPPPGQFLGTRPTAQQPDAQLSDDDRTGIRALYPDPNDVTNTGAITGEIVPANPFALAALGSPSTGSFVTGIVGAHVVVVDASTGSVIAGALSGWSCPVGSLAPQWDGTFALERLPTGHSYNLYAEPLVGLALPGAFSDILADPCSGANPACVAPAANTNFNVRLLPASQ